MTARPGQLDPAEVAVRLAAPPGEEADGLRRVLVEALRPDEWLAATRAAERHGIAPLVQARVGMDRSLAAHVPAAALSRLADAYLHSRLRSRSVRAQLVEILDALAEHGCLPVVLKGARLGDAVYGDPALRPHNDIDLLCAAEDLDAACRAMEGIGYSARPPTPFVDYEDHHHLPPFDRPGSLPVEVHRALDDPTAEGGMSVEAAWKRARPFEIDERAALALSPEDQLVHLCAHAAIGHRFDVPLLHLCDIAYASLSDRLPVVWEALDRIAAEAGLGDAVALAFEVTRRTVGEIPGPRASAPPVIELARGVRRQMLALGEDRIPHGVRHVLREPTVTARVRAVFRVLFPTRQELARIYERADSEEVGAGLRVRRLADLLAGQIRYLASFARDPTSVRSALRDESFRMDVADRLRALRTEGEAGGGSALPGSSERSASASSPS